MVNRAPKESRPIPGGHRHGGTATTAFASCVPLTILTLVAIRRSMRCRNYCEGRSFLYGHSSRPGAVT
jgi:hypothetical protein